MDDSARDIQSSNAFNRQYNTNHQEFKKIDAAIQYSNSFAFLPIWSADREDDLNPASKYFLVASYDYFISMYKELTPVKRNWYEIIRSVVPCHLHIDAEVIYEHNPTFDSKASEVAVFVEIFALLKELDVIGLEEDDLVHVETLDSSNAKKYSKHFIIKVQDKMFMNNFHAGAFMRTLINRISKRVDHTKPDGLFFIQDVYKGGKVVVKFLADMAIYTLNRNFRIYGSSKRTSGYRPLLLEGEKDDGVFKPAFLLNTLIQYIDPLKQPKNIICMLEPDGSVPVSMGNSNITILVHGNTAAKRKTVPDDGKIVVNVNTTKRFKAAIALPAFVADMISEIENIWGDGMKIINAKMDHSLNIVVFETRYSGCRMKREYHNDLTATHTDHIFFQSALKKKTFVQKCFSNNDECWHLVYNNYTKTYNKIRKSTQDYPFSQELCKKIEDYLLGLKVGDPAILADTVVQIYNIRLYLSDKIMF